MNPYIFLFLSLWKKCYLKIKTAGVSFNECYVQDLDRKLGTFELNTC